jgi:hypothetical protein
MKNELGNWTRRLFLCLSFSSLAGGFSRSMSFYSTTETTLMRIQSYKSNIENKKRAEPDLVGYTYHGGR